MFDVFVRLVDLPPSIHGFIMEDPAGDYNIYIRAGDPEELQRRTLDHELRHARLGHLQNETMTVEEKEREADYGRRDPLQKSRSV